MGVLRGLGMVAGLGPALVGASVRTSWESSHATVSVSSRAARGVAEAAVAAPATVVRLAVGLLADAPTRRLWAVDGRAQIEVWGLDCPGSEAVTRGVQDALTALEGVDWAPRTVGPSTTRGVRCPPLTPISPSNSSATPTSSTSSTPRTSCHPVRCRTVTGR